jgi:hypothetical protein
MLFEFFMHHFSELHTCGNVIAVRKRENRALNLLISKYEIEKSDSSHEGNNTQR